MPDNTTWNSVGRPGRILHRPVISWPTVFIFILVYIICLIILLLYIYYFPFSSDNSILTKIAIVIIYLIISISIFLKRICIFIIKLHQRYAPDQVRKMCNFEPSCSEYAILAINKYGVLKGIFMSYKRIKRCAPPGGVDYP